jgi:hypothetical protein
MDYQFNDHSTSDSQSAAHSSREGWSISVPGWGAAIGGDLPEHIFTSKCPRPRLALEVEVFSMRFERLAKTLSPSDFSWYRAAIIDAFDRVLDVDAPGIGEEEG